MRIIQITATYPPSINGVAISIDRLKKELEKRGHEVIVLAPDNPKRDITETGVIRYPSLPNPISKDYPLPLIPSIKTISRLLKDKKPEIVHTHHPFNIGNMSSMVARYYKIPLVFTYHTRYDAYAENYFRSIPNNIKKGTVKHYVDDFLNKPDLIISPSKSLANELLQKKPYLNIASIPSGLPEIPRVNEPKEAIKEKLNIPKGKTVLLTVCRVSQEKNLSLLIKSIGQLSDDFVLVVVGGGSYEKHLIELARKEGVERKVKFIGLIEHDKLGIYYQAADIFVYPSITETQGLIYLEALSFGLPIVAVESEASKEWVSKSMGILTKNTPIAFSKSIFKMTGEDKSSISRKAIDFAKQYRVSNTTQKLLAEYSKVIGQYKLGNKLLQTGWQSWSPRTSSIFRIPAWNYSPKPDEFLPVVSKEIKKKNPAIGWCSWYAFGFDISEEIILKQTEWFSKHKELPIKYILIDGGWTKNGDWSISDRKKFPHGIKYVSKRIKELGFKPGVWVAPFWADPNSVLFRQHPDWMAKNSFGYATGFKGFPFDRYFFRKYIVDIRKPDATTHLFECLNYLLLECGFELLKLDYLYSLYFMPNISTREAGSVLRNFLLEVKNRYPNVYTIACGCPLKPAIGLVDSMRIGPDVISPHLEKIPIIKNIVNTYKLNLDLGNIKKRIWTKEYWNLDPDAFVCRPTLGISDKKILELQRAIETSGGNVFLGDDMVNLSRIRVDNYIKPLFSNYRLTVGNDNLS